MKVVIFERDLSPLTIIDLPESLLEAGVKRGLVDVEMLPPTSPDYGKDDMGVPCVWIRVSIEVTRLQLHSRTGYCLVAQDQYLRPWLMPPVGKARTPAEFLRNRDELQRTLHATLARGLGGH